LEADLDFALKTDKKIRIGNDTTDPEKQFH